ncbi:MAG: transglycosylase domain-containing protein, partial [Alphaproteobacteria bacterium]
MLELFSLVTMSILGLGNDLPTDQRLLSYQPTSNVYVENQYGEELFVLGRQNREWADFEDFPTVLIDAVLSAEDKNFWTHDGVDNRALARASFQNFAKSANGQRLIGGSTISQQISKLVFVGSERSLKRKARELIVAKRMEKILGKSRILELYLNEIYMGRGAYGMKIAAKTYYNKHIDDLTSAEAATLASMIKAPGSYSKSANAERLLQRRNWVLQEMSENGFLDKDELAQSTQMPIGFVAYKKRTTSLDTYYEDLVRRDLADMLGEEKLQRGGFRVVVERNDLLQQQMEYSLSAGLEAIDSIYTHRGSWKRKKSDALKLKNWDLAKITETGRKSLQLSLSTGDTCSASVYAAGNHPVEGSVSSNFRVNEHIYVEFDGNDACFVRQVPKVSGGVVAVNANTGAIVATAGGYDYKVSKFNRAAQAYRQPGSTIKPLTYSAAFSSGYRPDQLVADAPVSIELPGGQLWQPQNADHKFL